MTVELTAKEVEQVISVCNTAICQCDHQIDYWNRFDTEYANHKKEQTMIRRTNIENLKSIFERKQRK